MEDELKSEEKVWFLLLGVVLFMMLLPLILMLPPVACYHQKQRYCIIEKP